MTCKRNFALICDDNYALPTAVTIKSLILNLKECATIYVFAVNLSEKNKIMLSSLSELSFKVVIKEVNYSDYEKYISNFSQKTHVSFAALIKFELSNLLPEDIEKIIYLDSDIIIKNDISELFEIELGDYYMAASFEFWKVLEKIRNCLDVSNVDFYFNSGVMLFDLDKFRKFDISNKLWAEKLRISNTESKLMDQDVFNSVLAGKCMPLDIKYNFNPRFCVKGSLKIEWINQIYNSKYIDFEDLYSNSCIVHFVGGEDKPWKYINGNCRELWDSYYILLGKDLNDLKRVNFKYDLRYYFSRIIFHIKRSGISGLIKYITKRYTY